MTRRKSLVEQIVELHAETALLCQSPLACRVADAWAAEPRSYDLKIVRGVTARLHDALDRLEELTRTSSLRKVQKVKP